MIPWAAAAPNFSMESSLLKAVPCLRLCHSEHIWSQTHVTLSTPGLHSQPSQLSSVHPKTFVYSTMLDFLFIKTVLSTQILSISFCWVNEIHRSAEYLYLLKRISVRSEGKQRPSLPFRGWMQIAVLCRKSGKDSLPGEGLRQLQGLKQLELFVHQRKV